MTVVAIDGPAGAGKSTVARVVARTLGFSFIDTGAMYRAVALAALREGVDPSDAARLGRLAGDLRIDVRDASVLLGGEDVSERIRADDVTGVVSRVSAHPGVRDRVGVQQARAARRGRVVMEGRDIGTVVAPWADVKVYLTAAVEERARRRALQAGLPLDPATLRRVEAELRRRDAHDAGREVAPLSQAPDAVEVDSTRKTVDEVVAEIVDLVRARAAAGER